MVVVVGGGYGAAHAHSARCFLRGVVSRLAQNVHRDGCELERGTAVEEVNLVVVGDVEQFAKHILRVVHQLVEVCRAVPHFSH